MHHPNQFRKSSHMHPQHSQNQFAQNKLSQASLGASRSNPGHPLESSPAADQIRQQRMVTSRKTAAKRGQRLLSSSNHNNTRGSLPPTAQSTSVKQQLVLEESQQNSQFLAPARGSQQNYLHLDQRVNLVGGSQDKAQTSSIVASIYSSIDYNNNNGKSSWDIQHGGTSPTMINPMLSGQTSQQNSCRQSLLAFNGTEVPTCHNSNNRHIGDGIEESWQVPQSAAAAASSTSNLHHQHHNFNNNERESLVSYNSAAAANIKNNVDSSNSLPPLQKQLLTRRNNQLPIGTANSTAQLNHSLSRREAVPSHSKISLQPSSLKPKLALSQKRQQQARHITVQSNDSSMDTLSHSHSQKAAAVLKSRFQQARGATFASQGPLAHSSHSNQPHHPPRLQQRIPSFKKRRLENTTNSRSSNADFLGNNSLVGLASETSLNSNEEGGSTTRFRKQGPGAAGQDNNHVMQIKSRLSLASATVDSRRSSYKKIQKGSTNNSHKASQQNFHTIPIKENSSLPTPEDSSKPATKQGYEKEFHTFSSKVQMTQVTTSVTTHHQLSQSNNITAKSQRQMRFAGALPTQRLQLIDHSENQTSRYPGPSWMPEELRISGGGAEKHTFQERGVAAFSSSQQFLKDAQRHKVINPIVQQSYNSGGTRFQTQEAQQRPNCAMSKQAEEVAQSSGKVQSSQRQVRYKVLTGLDNSSDRPFESNKSQKESELPHELPSSTFYLPVQQVVTDQKMQSSQREQTQLDPSKLQQFQRQFETTSMNSCGPQFSSLSAQAPLLTSLQQRSTGTRNQQALLQNHNSQEAPQSKKVPVEFQLQDRRADSRPRAGPRVACSGTGSRFQQMRQRIYKVPDHHHSQAAPQQTQQQQQPSFMNNQASVGLETTSVEINESLGAQMVPRQIGVSQQRERDSAEYQVREGGVGDPSNSVHQLINEMSYIQNASSNENLLSPYMFSSNSLSPSNHHALNLGEPQNSNITSTVGGLSPDQAPQLPKYSSLERSLQKVVVPLNTSTTYVGDSGTKSGVNTTVGRVRKHQIRKKSVPSSKLFPPGFFADNNSIDSKHSPQKHQTSIDSSHHHHQKQPQNNSKATARSFVLSQRPSEVMQREALEKTEAYVLNQLNSTLSPTRSNLIANGDNKKATEEQPKRKLINRMSKDRTTLPTTTTSQIMHQAQEIIDTDNDVSYTSRHASSCAKQMEVAAQSCHGLNVAMPSTANQGLIGRNASQNLQCPPEIQKMNMVQVQSKSHCPSKMEISKTSTSGEQKTTFSDRVQRNIIDINKKVAPVVVQHTAVAAAPSNPAAKNETSTGGSAVHQSLQSNGNNYALNQNWVHNITTKTTTQSKSKSKQQQDLSIQDTSGVLSQSTATASSGTKMKISPKLQEAFDAHQTKQISDSMKTKMVAKNLQEQGKSLQRGSIRQNTNPKLQLKLKVTKVQQQNQRKQTSTEKVASPTMKFSNTKAPMPIFPQAKFSQVSSPPQEQFTPYMNGVLSPNDRRSDEKNKEEETLLGGSGADFSDYGDRYKIVSFGQSRCETSQQEQILNGSLGGQQGIMTFGNFASLLEDQQMDSSLRGQNSPGKITKQSPVTKGTTTALLHQ